MMNVIFEYNPTKTSKYIPQYFRKVQQFDNADSVLTLYSADAPERIDSEIVKKSVETFFYEKYGFYPDYIHVRTSSLTIEVAYNSKKISLGKKDLQEISDYVKSKSKLKEGFTFVSAQAEYIEFPKEPVGKKTTSKPKAPPPADVAVSSATPATIVSSTPSVAAGIPVVSAAVSPAISPAISPAVSSVATAPSSIHSTGSFKKILIWDDILPIANLAKDPMQVFRNLKRKSWKSGEEKESSNYIHIFSHRYTTEDTDYPQMILDSWKKYDSSIQVISIELVDENFGVFQIKIKDVSLKKLNLNDPIMGEHLLTALLSRYISSTRVFDKELWNASILIGINKKRYFYGPSYRENCIVSKLTLIESESPKTFDTCLDTASLIKLAKFLAVPSIHSGKTRETAITEIARYLGTYNQELWKDRILLIFWNILRIAVFESTNRTITELSTPFTNVSDAESKMRKNSIVFEKDWTVRFPQQYPALYTMGYVIDRLAFWKEQSLNDIKLAYHKNAELVESSLKPILSVGSGWLKDDDIERILKIFEQRTNNQFQYIPIRFGEGNYEIPFYKEFLPNAKWFGSVFNTSQKGGGSHWVAAFVDLTIPSKKDIVLEYSDSLNGPITKEIELALDMFMEAIDKYLDAYGFPPLSFDNMKKLNKPKQKGATECGVYAIQFIDMRISGYTWEEYNSMEISDERCEIQRDYYWRALKRRKDYLSYIDTKYKCYNDIGSTVLFGTDKNIDASAIASKMESIFKYIADKSDFIVKLNYVPNVKDWNLEKQNIDTENIASEFSKPSSPWNAGFLVCTMIEGKLYFLLQMKKDVNQSYWNIPGGHSEPEDYNPIYTALREFWEEAGLKNPINLCEATSYGMVKKTGVPNKKDYYLLIAGFPFDYVRILELEEGKKQDEVDTSYVSQNKKWYLSPGYEWFSLDALTSLYLKEDSPIKNIQMGPKPDYPYLTSNIIVNLRDPYFLAWQGETSIPEMVEAKQREKESRGKEAQVKEDVKQGELKQGEKEKIPEIIEQQQVKKDIFKFKVDCDHHELGKRESQEDTSVVSFDYPYGVYAIFDGHGGDQVSKALVEKFKNLPKYIKENKMIGNKEVTLKSIIYAFFIKTDRELLDEMPNADSGSTATVVVLDNKNGKVFVANLGDSGTVIFDKSGAIVYKTTSQGVESEIEQNRIELSGWPIIGIGKKQKRIGGNLNVARAFGDFTFKQKYTEDLEIPVKTKYLATEGGVSVAPDIDEVKLDQDEDYSIILACDGLWDYVPAPTVVQFITSQLSSKQLTPPGICKTLAEKAIKEFKSTDNVSVMLISISAKDITLSLEPSETKEKS